MLRYGVLVGRAYRDVLCRSRDLHCCLTSLSTQQCYNDENHSSHMLLMQTKSFTSYLSTLKLANNIYKMHIKTSSSEDSADDNIPSSPLRATPFPPLTLFASLEVFAHTHNPSQPTTHALWIMLTSLEAHGVVGYGWLKRWMLQYRETGRLVREKSQRGKYSRHSVGCKILLDGWRFRDLARAYFEVVEIVENGEVWTEKEGEGGRSGVRTLVCVGFQ